MMDRSSYGIETLRAEARERRLGPDAQAPGPKSWIASATAATLREVLSAADAGIVLAATPHAAPANATATPHTASASPNAAQSLADAIATIAASVAAPAPAIDAEAIASMAKNAALDAMIEARRNILAEATEAARAASAVTVTIAAPGRPVRDMGAQHPQFSTLAAALGIGQAVLLFGEAGSGKSHGAGAAAEALGLRHAAKSFSPDTGSHEVFGFVHAAGGYVSTSFRDCYENGGVYIADEMDNANAGTVAAFNLALANGSCTFPDGVTVKRHPDFRFVATANTVHGATQSFNGREALDAAFVSRCFPIRWDIDKRFEVSLAVARARAAAESNGRDADAAERDARAFTERVQRARTAAYAAGLGRVAACMARAALHGADSIGAGVVALADADFLFTATADDAARERILAAANGGR